MSATEPTTLVLLGENDEQIAEVVFSNEEFAEIEAAIALTGETIEEFVNKAIREGLNRDAE